MPASADLRQQILTSAGELFARQGYVATTNKQIAAASGCTTAALYYYYPNGKPQILSEVVRSYAATVRRVFDLASDAASLADFVVRLAQTLAEVTPDIMRRMSWILADFGKLQAEEQECLHALLREIHARVTTGVGRFVADDEDAKRLAWLIFCAYFGYEQIFLTLDLRRVDPTSYQQLARTLAHVLTDQRGSLPETERAR